MSDQSNLEAIELLKNPESSQSDFSKSLIAQYAAKGYLSEKQWWWVRRLAAEAALPPREAVSVGGSFEGVVALFAKASAKLTYPMILLRTPEGQDLMLTLAGPTSKNAGSVYVKTGDREYLGKVAQDGTYTPALRADVSASIPALLTALAQDPAGTAKAYGKLTGCCCFCGIQFSNDKSIALGYGPTCAKNYDLPYTAEAVRLALAETPAPDAYAERVAEKTAFAAQEQAQEEAAFMAKSLYEDRPSRTMDLLRGSGAI